MPNRIHCRASRSSGSDRAERCEPGAIEAAARGPPLWQGLFDSLVSASDDPIILAEARQLVESVVHPA